jgi:hypothetical protein
MQIREREVSTFNTHKVLHNKIIFDYYRERERESSVYKKHYFLI